MDFKAQVVGYFARVLRWIRFSIGYDYDLYLFYIIFLIEEILNIYFDGIIDDSILHGAISS